MRFHTAKLNLAIESVLQYSSFIIHYILRKNVVMITTETLEGLTFTLVMLPPRSVK